MTPTQTIIGNGKFDAAAPKDETSVYRNQLPPSIKPEARKLLVEYSKIDPDEVDTHVLALVSSSIHGSSTTANSRSVTRLSRFALTHASVIFGSSQ